MQAQVHTLPKDTKLSAERLAALFEVTEPTLVARENREHRKPFEVWDANGIGIMVRWDKKAVQVWTGAYHPVLNRRATGKELATVFNKVPLAITPEELTKLPGVTPEEMVSLGDAFVASRGK